MNEVLGLGDSLLVTVVGLAIVFLGLTILIFLIKALILLTQRMQGRKQAPSVAPAPAAAPVQETAVPQEVTEEEDEGELIAVITAAIACMLTEEKGFTVRRIRRIENSSSWQRAGREEQTYSHY